MTCMGLNTCFYIHRCICRHIFIFYNRIKWETGYLYSARSMVSTALASHQRDKRNSADTLVADVSDFELNSWASRPAVPRP